MSGIPDCALCGSSASALVRVGVRHGPEVEVRRCAGCGLVYAWPRPTAEELARYYADDYRADYEEPSLAERHAGDRSDALRRVAALGPLLGPSVALLEVGSGSGAFLESVRPHVGSALGVEPERAAREWLAARGGPPLLPELDAVDGSFDLIVAFHVLEHVPDPVGFLRRLRPLLREHGTLVVEVPSVDDVLVAVYGAGAYLPFYYQKAHLSYFSPATLARALRLAGYEARVEGVQRYGLGNHLHWALEGRPGGQGAYPEVVAPEVDAVYAAALVRAGRADTLWATAR